MWTVRLWRLVLLSITKPIKIWQMGQICWIVIAYRRPSRVDCIVHLWTTQWEREVTGLARGVESRRSVLMTGQGLASSVLGSYEHRNMYIERQTAAAWGVNLFAILEGVRVYITTLQGLCSILVEFFVGFLWVFSWWFLLSISIST